MVSEIGAEFIADGFSWVECPRWHQGALYFADMYSARIIRVESDGSRSVYADFSHRIGLDGARVVTAGFGFLSDGRLIVNSMFERVVLVWDGTSEQIYADLRDFAPGPVNELVVDDAGRAYVTQLGYDVWKGAEPVSLPLLLVQPSGEVSELRDAGLLTGANGITISADGRTVVTAESPERRLIAFDRADDGNLSNPRVFAQLDLLPDGICFDSEGAVWAAQPGGGVLRVLDGGEISVRVTMEPELSGRTIACALGGEDRRTLYVCCGFEVRDFDKSVREAQGSLWKTRVDFSGGEARP